MNLHKSTHFIYIFSLVAFGIVLVTIPSSTQAAIYKLVNSKTLSDTNQPALYAAYTPIDDTETAPAIDTTDQTRFETIYNNPVRIPVGSVPSYNFPSQVFTGYTRETKQNIDSYHVENSYPMHPEAFPTYTTAPDVRTFAFPEFTPERRARTETNPFVWTQSPHNSSVSYPDSVVTETTHKSKLGTATTEVSPNKYTTISGEITTFINDDFTKGSSHYSYEIESNGTVYQFVPNDSERDLGMVRGFAIVHGIVQENQLTGYIENKHSLEKLDSISEYGNDTRQNRLQTRSSTPHNTLVLLTYFYDSENLPFTREQAVENIFNGQFQKLTQEQSYGQAVFTGDVYGWLQLPKRSSNGQCNYNGVNSQTQINKFASENNIDLAKYDHVVFVFNCYGTSTQGSSTVGVSNYSLNGVSKRVSRSFLIASQNNPRQAYTDPSVWIRWNTVLANPNYDWTNMDTLLAHELGHAMGLQHADGLDCGTKQIGTNCNQVSYGNHYDVMGYGGALSLHYNAQYKRNLGWIDDSSIVSIAKSGTYTLVPMERNTGKRLAYVSLPENPNVPIYALEYRRGIGFDSRIAGSNFGNSQEGLYIYKMYHYGNGINIAMLIDARPTTQAWWEDMVMSSLQTKYSFVDSKYGLGITVDNQNENIIHLNVYFKSEPCSFNPPKIEKNANSVYDIVSAKRGELISISRTIKNQNTVSCLDSSMTNAVFPVSDFLNNNYNFPSIVNSAAQSAYDIVKNGFISRNALPGMYEMDFKVTDSLTNLTSTEKINIQVLQ